MKHFDSRDVFPYIVLENIRLKWVWKEEDVSKFEDLWREGYSILDIARFFKVKPIDILLLALDRAEQGYIRSRPGSIFGNKKSDLQSK